MIEHLSAKEAHHGCNLQQERRLPQALFVYRLEHADATVVANALIVLVQRTLSLLGKQLQSQESVFVETGGIRERMTQARVAARDANLPACPECGKPMRKRHSTKGDFWGCSDYPACRGIRDIPQPSP